MRRLDKANLFMLASLAVWVAVLLAIAFLRNRNIEAADSYMAKRMQIMNAPPQMPVASDDCTRIFPQFSGYPIAVYFCGNVLDTTYTTTTSDTDLTGLKEFR